MKPLLLIVASLFVVWFVAAQFGRRAERRRRRPVVEALGGHPSTKLDLAAADLMELVHDRICLVYWTEQAMAWQYTRRQNLISVIRFDDIAGVALDPNILVLAIETNDGRHHAWQFRQSGARLCSSLMAAIGKACPDSGRGTPLLQEVRSEIGPLLWGG